MPQTFEDRIDSSNTVTVIFSQGTSDRVRFDRIGKLRAALIDEDILAGNITMKSSDGTGKKVAPLFNGDDMFDTPSSPGASKVFGGAYANNATIFEGFVVKNTGTNTGWYIDNVGNKPIYVNRIKARGGYSGFTRGFGLQSLRSCITFVDSVITGLPNPSADASDIAAVTPDYLTSALSYLGIVNAADIPSDLFTMQGLEFRANMDSGLDKNLQDYPIILNLLDKYMPQSGTDNRTKLNGLTVTASGFGSLFLQKSNPYSGNAISVAEADKVNGNLAVWLGSKNVALREVYLTNPSLYNTIVSDNIGMRNAVLVGNNWKNIKVAGSGVIVSVDTPVAGIPSSSNLWYVVQGQSSTHVCVVTTTIIEVASGLTQYNKIAPSSTNLIGGMITPNSAVRSSMNGNWNVPSSKDYYPGSANGPRPSTTTWSSYADTVKNGGTPVVQ
jgi:hypothetical protein